MKLSLLRLNMFPLQFIFFTTIPCPDNLLLKIPIASSLSFEMYRGLDTTPLLWYSVSSSMTHSSLE